MAPLKPNMLIQISRFLVHVSRTRKLVTTRLAAQEITYLRFDKKYSATAIIITPNMIKQKS